MKKYLQQNLVKVIFLGALFLSAFLWIGTMLIEKSESSQFDFFFYRCGDFFADTLNVLHYVELRNPYFDDIANAAEHAYPPLAYICFYLLRRVASMQDGVLNTYKEPHFLIMYFFVVILIMVLLFFVFCEKTKGNRWMRLLLPIAVCFNRPVLYSIERGNILVLTLVFIAFFVLFYDDEDAVARELALISLGIAFGLKLSPAIFGMLLVYDRKWKEAVRAAIYGIISFVVPFFFFHGGFINNVMQLIANTRANLAKYDCLSGCGLTASAYQMFMRHGWQFNNGWIAFFRILTYVACLILVIGGFRCKKQWQRVLALALVCVILPSHSGSYNTIYFLPATFLLVQDEEIRLWNVAFVVLMLPLYWLHVDAIYRTYNFSYVIPWITLLMVVYVICQWGDYLKLGKAK